MFRSIGLFLILILFSVLLISNHTPAQGGQEQGGQLYTGFLDP